MKKIIGICIVLILTMIGFSGCTGIDDTETDMYIDSIAYSVCYNRVYLSSNNWYRMSTTTLFKIQDFATNTSTSTQSCAEGWGQMTETTVYNYEINSFARVVTNGRGMISIDFYEKEE